MTGPHRPTALDRLENVERAVTRLSQLVANLAHHADAPPGPSIWAWENLTAEQAATQWEELTQWLAWLTARYPRALRDLPPCWHLHTDAVEELGALWAAWLAAYHGADDPTDKPITWHDRWLPGTTHRLLGPTGTLTPCARNHTHTPPSPAPRDQHTDPDEPTLHEHIAADIDRRSHPPIQL